MRSRPIPEATVARLPVYLRCLLEVAEGRGEMTVSSEELARMAGVNAAKVRKDLSYLGSYGTRGVGYDVEYLLYQITRELGLTQDWPAAIMGVGNLGRALASYKGFSERGFRIVALFDTDEKVIGKTVANLVVRHIDDLKEVCADQAVSIGIIATPPQAAQEVAEKLVDAGVKSILNFAPAVVNVAPDITVRKVDLSIELQILSFYQQRLQAIATAREANRRLGGIR
ncbi:MAG: redox-sensing transcriptional repressor Rex [Actinomycetota bacterium]|nr:redox-sensing transcriptional repressor Rex [Actinomycetota bacterium]